MESKTAISIVVPVYNEEESLVHFFTSLHKELPRVAKTYEVVFVDDGSTDKSLSILQDLQRKHAFVRVFSFRKNLGKAEALSCGFQMAKGEIVVTMDADLQDQPTEIAKLLAKQREGFDVVCGWRKNRKDQSKMKVISRLFNGTVQKVFGLALHDYNCGLKLYTAPAAKSLHLYGGLHRFIPVLIAQEGFRITEVVVHHEPRRFGMSKYGFSKIFRDLPDIFTMIFLVKYGKRPLHFFGMVGGVMSAAAIIILVYLTILHFMGQSIGNRPLLLFGILLFLAGLQIFFTGFLAELIISLQHAPSDKNNRSFPLKYTSDRSL